MILFYWSYLVTGCKDGFVLFNLIYKWPRIFVFSYSISIILYTELPGISLSWKKFILPTSQQYIAIINKDSGGKENFHLGSNYLNCVRALDLKIMTADYVLFKYNYVHRVNQNFIVKFAERSTQCWLNGMHNSLIYLIICVYFMKCHYQDLIALKQILITIE